jgi:2-iminobutanoate/2-iminopropanoate deaminase
MSAKPAAAREIRKIVAADVAEPPPGVFSNCLAVGDTIYVSGQHAGADAGAIGGANMLAQAREAFRRVVALVRAAGAAPADIVKLTIYVTDMTRRGEVSAARKEFFAEPFPCSTLVEIAALAAPDLLVEIEAIAVLRAAPEGDAR